MISFEQESFSDRVRNKGNIVINLDHGVSFSIEDIANPQKVVNILRSQKWEFKVPEVLDEQENYLENNNDKFAILVETLGEVIKDYMDKWQRPKIW